MHHTPAAPLHHAEIRDGADNQSGVDAHHHDVRDPNILVNGEPRPVARAMLRRARILRAVWSHRTPHRFCKLRLRRDRREWLASEGPSDEPFRVSPSTVLNDSPLSAERDG